MLCPASLETAQLVPCATSNEVLHSSRLRSSFGADNTLMVTRGPGAFCRNVYSCQANENEFKDLGLARCPFCWSECFRGSAILVSPKCHHLCFFSLICNQYTREWAPFKPFHPNVLGPKPGIRMIVQGGTDSGCVLCTTWWHAWKRSPSVWFDRDCLR